MGTLIGRTLLTLVMAVWVAPIYWLVNTAFKEKAQIQSSAPVWFPSPITFDNMQWVYENLDPAAFARSLRVVAISVGVSLIMGPIMAYALSRFQIGIWRRRVCCCRHRPTS